MKGGRTRHLPGEIIMDILTRLPVKSILRFRPVCKNWYNLFQNPDFIKMHLHHSNQMNYFSLILTKHNDDDDGYPTFPSIDYNHSLSLFDKPVEYCCPFKYHLGACNGLICIRTRPKVVCIWNPCTKEYMKLPSNRAYGVGYNCETGDYKVVRIVTPDWDLFSHVIVYTLGTDSWRILQDIPYRICLSGQNRVHLNGVVHWMLNSCSRVNEGTRVIVSFGIGDENFKEMQLPIPLRNKPAKSVSRSTLCLLGGHLRLAGNLLDYANIYVYILKDYGVRFLD